MDGKFTILILSLNSLIQFYNMKYNTNIMIQIFNIYLVLVRVANGSAHPNCVDHIS